MANISHHPMHFVNTEGGIFTGKGVLNSPLALFLVQVSLISFTRFVLHRLVGAGVASGAPGVLFVHSL